MVRARDLDIPFSGAPGTHNAITDVAGVHVGHTTLIEGENVRTGVTAVLPRGRVHDPVFAGVHVLNGNGEMTGTHWITEAGWLEGPVMITNTHAVGTVHDAVVRWTVERALYHPIQGNVFWSLPVVAETWDGTLNDINAFPLRREHVFAALDGASAGAVAEGNVGGGTGMICHGFKGGIGTSSRRVSVAEGAYVVGVLVQANHGARHNLTIAGVPVGQAIADLRPRIQEEPPKTSSIIVVVATDAPLLPHQCRRLAQRAALGIGRVGGMGENSSGDIMVAFSTANPGAWHRSEIRAVAALPNDALSPIFEATVYATEEAIANALVAAETMTGFGGNTVYALPHDRLRAVLRRYGRLVESGEAEA